MRSLYDSWVSFFDSYDLHYITIKDFHFYNCIELNDKHFIEDD